ncbi:MAG: glutamate formimidoyltransferase [Candidatus Zixiibacteriota bacterium]|nr:MAG: glutamate formimidoyltransferase [candidate division Zixibacteria bacterium]
MDKIVECVPNFSEGRNREVIDRIADAVRRTEGAKLLDVDPNVDYNRTVFTFVGTPEGVLQAALAAFAAGAEGIDMSGHKGEHPRMGAADVVPFIPVRGVSMADCVALSERFGAEIAQRFSLPVYLYEHAARSPQRRNLAEVRKGEYEGLPEKLQDPQWLPDFGHAVFNPKLGATITGARIFLIAYNANVRDPNPDKAQEIALRIRESGRVKRGPDGKILKDEAGNKIVIPGKLKAVKAMGVALEEYKISQVSINLVDYHVTPPHIAYEAVKEEAATLDAVVSGSEIVGLTPLEPLLMAGAYYCQLNHLPPPATDAELVEAGIRGLGLSDLYPFDANKKIIEYMI